MKIWIALTGLILLASTAHAERLRCGNRLVRTGDTRTEVLQKCGEPLSRDIIGVDTHRRYRYGAVVTTERVVEEWVYSDRQMLRTLYFRGGVLVNIETSR